MYHASHGLVPLTENTVHEHRGKRGWSNGEHTTRLQLSLSFSIARPRHGYITSASGPARTRHAICVLALWLRAYTHIPLIQTSSPPIHPRRVRANTTTGVSSTYVVWIEPKQNVGDCYVLVDRYSLCTNISYLLFSTLSRMYTRKNSSGNGYIRNRSISHLSKVWDTAVSLAR